MARRTSAGPVRVATVTTVGLGALLTVLGGPTSTAPAASPAPGAVPAAAPAVHGPRLPGPPAAAVSTPGPPATAPPVAAAPAVAAPAVATGGRSLPVRVRLAYERAAGAVDPACGLQWSLLAGIGHVESGHARGGRLDAAGRTTTPIVGLPLDGAPGVRAIPDSDGGRYDGDTVWDRAVGPMQFIPGTWAAYGADGDGDGTADPHQIDDATLAAARYLCAGGTDLGTATGARSAVLRYNLSTSYATRVLLLDQAYRTGRPAGRLPGIGATPNGSAGDGVPTSARAAAPAGPPAVEPPPAGPPPAALPAAPAAVIPPPAAPPTLVTPPVVTPPAATPPVVTPPVVTPPTVTPPPASTPPVTTPPTTAPPATTPPETPPASTAGASTSPPDPPTTGPTTTSAEPPPTGPTATGTGTTTGTAASSGAATAAPTCPPADPATPAPTTTACPTP